MTVICRTKQLGIMKNTIYTKNITVANHNLKVEVVTIGAGKHPKAFLYVNNQEWTSINAFNLLADENYINTYNQDLIDGAYTMFI